MGALNVVPMIIICTAFIISLLTGIFLSIKINPIRALWVMFSTSFSSFYHFTETLVKMTPIVFTGLAVGCALKMKLWNIGAEGQLYMGAFGTVWVAQSFANLPGFLLIPLMVLAALFCGALWGALAGVLKRLIQVNEILTTLLLNYVAVSFVNYFIYGPWRDPRNPGFPITQVFVRSAWLPRLFNTRLHIWFIAAFVLALLVWILIERTSWGFEIRAAGESLSGAKYAGIPVERNIILIFMLSGAIAGLAGMGEAAGIHHKLQPGNISANYGSLGIIVAWLSGANPFGTILVAFLGGVLLKGAENLQVTMGVSSNVVQIMIGLLLASFLICIFFKDNKITLIFKGGKNHA
jgi:simple sugar transport system permease protein